MQKTFRLREGKIVEGPGDGAPIHLFINPDSAEEKRIVENFKIDEHTLKSTLDPDERGRVEFEPDHCAIIFKRPRSYSSKDNFLFQMSSIGIFLFSDKLLLIQLEDSDLFKGRLFQKIGSLNDLSLKIILATIHHFGEHLKVINLCSEELEKEVNTSMENKHLLNLFTLEKSMVYYINALSANHRVISKIRRNATKTGLTPEDLEFVEDMGIECAQCLEQSQTYSQVLSSLMDARASIVSNNLNVLMKTLNLVMVGLMLPSLWMTLFSMNVPIPFQHSHLLFWVVVTVSVASTWALIRVLSKKRY